jgi:hypothetical protein
MDVGINELFDFLANYAPAADTIAEVNETGANGALVYKTIVDPFQGRISYALVKGGQLTPNSDMYNVNKQIKVKVGALGMPNGKDMVPAEAVCAGYRLRPAGAGRHQKGGRRRFHAGCLRHDRGAVCGCHAGGHGHPGHV